jgi:hypothetical protein
MSFTATHRASVLVLASGQIPQIVNWRHNFGITRAAIAGSGALSDATSGVVQQAPTATLSTTAIVSALTALGSIVSPYSIAAAATLYLRKTVHGGTFASGSTHSKLAGSLGIAVPRTLRLSQTQFATLDMELMWVSSDGATAPIAFTQSVALPTLTMASEKFVLGPIYLNDALTEGIDSVEIDFGMRAKSIFHNGFVLPDRLRGRPRAAGDPDPDDGPRRHRHPHHRRLRDLRVPDAVLRPQGGRQRSPRRGRHHPAHQVHDHHHRAFHPGRGGRGRGQ